MFFTMNSEQLCESLMKWLHTFSPNSPQYTAVDLSDGVVMASVLGHIAPDWFDHSWMSRIKQDVGDNWRLKVSNLRKVHQGIVDYNRETGSLALNSTNFTTPDLKKIGENSDVTELGRLLQLILGCAVYCEQKQEYIEAIMGMEESVQSVIMQAIQELMNREGSPPSGEDLFRFSPQIRRVMSELDLANREKDRLAQQCHDLTRQNALLQDEKSLLSTENVNLQERLKSIEAVDDGTSSGAVNARMKDLRKQLEMSEQELYKMETSRDEFRSKVEELHKELTEFRSRESELQRAAGEARTLKDEVDILRESSEKVAQYEGIIESYRKKMEELGDLKRQIRLLEDKNTDYMQQNMELEEELKKSGTWKPQVELYKKQVTELHQRLEDESHKADKAEFDLRKLQEKMSTVQREKERLTAERDALKESLEEMKLSQLQVDGSSRKKADSADNAPLLDSTTFDMVPPEIKEKLLRLQHENRCLRESGNGAVDEKVSVLQAMVDDLTERNTQLHSQSRWASEPDLRELSLNSVQDSDRCYLTLPVRGTHNRMLRLTFVLEPVGLVSKDEDREIPECPHIRCRSQNSNVRKCPVCGHCKNRRTPLGRGFDVLNSPFDGHISDSSDDTDIVFSGGDSTEQLWSTAPTSMSPLKTSSPLILPKSDSPIVKARSPSVDSNPSKQELQIKIHMKSSPKLSRSSDQSLSFGSGSQNDSGAEVEQRNHCSSSPDILKEAARLRDTDKLQHKIQRYKSVEDILTFTESDIIVHGDSLHPIVPVKHSVIMTQSPYRAPFCRRSIDSPDFIDKDCHSLSGSPTPPIFSSPQQVPHIPLNNQPEQPKIVMRSVAGRRAKPPVAVPPPAGRTSICSEDLKYLRHGILPSDSEPVSMIDTSPSPVPEPTIVQPESLYMDNGGEDEEELEIIYDRSFRATNDDDTSDRLQDLRVFTPPLTHSPYSRRKSGGDITVKTLSTSPPTDSKTENCLGNGVFYLFNMCYP